MLVGQCREILGSGRGGHCANVYRELGACGRVEGYIEGRSWIYGCNVCIRLLANLSQPPPRNPASFTLPSQPALPSSFFKPRHRSAARLVLTSTGSSIWAVLRRNEDVQMRGLSSEESVAIVR